MTNSTSSLLTAWLKDANYTFSESYFRQRFLSHPDAPGVAAITDTLNDLSIDNMAVEIEFPELHKLEHPFIAYIRQDRQEQFALVQKKDNHSWEVKLEADKQIVVPAQKFQQLFTGLVVLIDPAPAKRFRGIRKWLQAAYIAPALIVCGFLLSFIGNAGAVLHFIFGLAGLTASALIAAKELGLNTGRLEKLCTLSTTTSCDAVLKSRYSAIAGNNKVYDVSLVFFALQLFAWLFYFPLQPQTAAYQYAISLVAVPVTFASLYLQRFVLKTWCPLCLFICGALWAQAIVAGIEIFPWTGLELSIPSLLLYATAALLIWTAWQFMKKQLQASAENEDLTIKQLSFRRNYHLFMPLYMQLPELKTNIAGIKEITMGARNAGVNMIVVSNPFCSTCIALHRQLHGLTAKYPELGISLRFYVPVENSSDKRTLIAAKLVELYLENTQAGLAEIDAWYDNPDTDSFYRRNSRKHNTDALQVLKLHRQWCHEQNIFVTPTIIVNGKRFPMFYDPEDVGFFLEEIIRTSKTRVNHRPEQALSTVLS